MKRAILTAMMVGALCLPAVGHSNPVGGDQEGPNRSGFTLELGIGLAYTMISPDVGDGQSKWGLAPLSLGLGWFINDRMAIMFRVAGTSYFEDIGGSTEQILNAFYGVVGQYWFSDQFFGSAGIGFAVYGPNPLLTSLEFDPETGWGLSLRVGYSFLTTRNHALRVALELLPSFYDGTKVIGTAINVEWQLL